MTNAQWLSWIVGCYFGLAGVLAIIGLWAPKAKDLAKMMVEGLLGFFWSHPRLTAIGLAIVVLLLVRNTYDGSITLAITNQRDSGCISEQAAVQAMKDGFEARTKKLTEALASGDPAAIAEYKKLKNEHTQQLNDFYNGGSACGTRTPAEVQAAEQRSASFTPSAAAAPAPAPSTPTDLKFEKRHGNGSWGEVPEADVSSTDPLGTWRVTFPANRYAITNIQLGGNTLEFGAVSGNVRLHPKDTFPCGPEGGPRLNQSWIPSHDQFIVKDADAKLCELIVGFNGQNGSFVPALRPREHTGTNGSLVLSVNHRISPGSGDEAMYAAGQATAEFTIR